MRGVVQGENGVLPRLAGAESNGGILRGFADGVVEEVGKGLREPERIGLQFEAGRQVACKMLVFPGEARGIFIAESLPEGDEGDGLLADGVFFDA